MSDSRSVGIGEFRGDIEGLRALAVVLVVLFHAGVPWLSGGFVGVDVFFVISGFLITRLLLLECVRTQKVSLRQFWARRVRRLLPNAALTLVTVVAVSFFFLDSVSMRQIGQDVTAAALFVANFWFRSRATDYFDEGADRSGVLHFWSLSVEEQYYLIWPPLLAAFLAVQLRAKQSLPVIFRRTFAILSVCAVFSFGWFLKNAVASPVVGYYATQARLWELAAGGLIAFSLHGGYGGLLRSAALAWPGALLILGAAFGFGGIVPERWTLVLVVPAVLGACLMLFSGAAPAPSAISRWFGQAIPRRIGQWSYSWYLWHWPFLVLGPALLGDLSPLQTLLIVLASLLLAAATYTLFENPIRHSASLAAHPGRTLALGFILVGGVALAGIALAEAGNDATPEMKIAIKAEGDKTTAHFDGCLAQYGIAQVKRCRYGKIGSTQRWILWGDSHAVQLLPAFEAQAQRAGVELTLYGKVACPPVQLPVYSSKQKRSYTECSTWINTVIDEVESSAPGTVVFLIAYSSYTLETSQGELLEAVASKRQLAAGLRNTVERLTARGLRVVSIRDTPRFERNPARCLSTARGDATRCSFVRPLESKGLSWDKQVLGDLPKIDFIDLNDHICEPDFCPLVVNGVGVWRDDDHITATYSRALSEPLGAQLKPLLGDPSLPPASR